MNKYENISAARAIELAKEHPDWWFKDCEGNVYRTLSNWNPKSQAAHSIDSYKPFTAYTLTPVCQGQISADAIKLWIKNYDKTTKKHPDVSWEQKYKRFKNALVEVIDSMTKEQDV